MLISLRIVPKFKIRDNDKEQFSSDEGLIELFRSWLLMLANLKWAKDGDPSKSKLQGLKQRTFGRLLDKLDGLTIAEVDIEKAELDILKELFLADDMPILPAQAQMLNYYRTKLEEAITADTKKAIA